MAPGPTPRTARAVRLPRPDRPARRPGARTTTLRPVRCAAAAKAAPASCSGYRCVMTDAASTTPRCTRSSARGKTSPMRRATASVRPLRRATEAREGRDGRRRGCRPARRGRPGGRRGPRGSTAGSAADDLEDHVDARPRRMPLANMPPGSTSAGSRTASAPYAQGRLPPVGQRLDGDDRGGPLRRGRPARAAARSARSRRPRPRRRGARARGRPRAARRRAAPARCPSAAVIPSGRSCSCASGQATSSRSPPSTDPWPAKRTVGQRLRCPVRADLAAPARHRRVERDALSLAQSARDHAGHLVPEHQRRGELRVADAAVGVPVQVGAAQPDRPRPARGPSPGPGTGGGSSCTSSRPTATSRATCTVRRPSSSVGRPTSDGALPAAGQAPPQRRGCPQPAPGPARTPPRSHRV